MKANADKNGSLRIKQIIVSNIQERHEFILTHFVKFIYSLFLIKIKNVSSKMLIYRVFFQNAPGIGRSTLSLVKVRTFLTS